MWWLRTIWCSDESELREQKLGWSRGRILIWIQWRNHQVGIRFDKMFASTDFIKLNSKWSRCIFCNYNPYPWILEKNPTKNKKIGFWELSQRHFWKKNPWALKSLLHYRIQINLVTCRPTVFVGVIIQNFEK